jgi:hypothetical protein
MKQFVIIILISISFWGCKNEHRKKAETKKETNKKASILNINVVGKYIYNENGIDEITLIVSEKQNRYFYSLKTKIRSIHGNVSISKDTEDNIYIILNGIKWQLNTCNSPDEDDDADEEVKDSVINSSKKKKFQLKLDCRMAIMNLYYRMEEIGLSLYHYQNAVNIIFI